MIVLLKENEKFEGVPDDLIEKWPTHEVQKAFMEDDLPSKSRNVAANSSVVLSDDLD